jgi:hypothetical protein
MKTDLILPWITQHMGTLTYADLQNVGYALMFMEVTDENILKSFIKAVNKQDLVCPLPYFKCLKLVEYYVSHLYPKWDYSIYQDTLFEASRNHNPNRMSKSYERKEYTEVSQALIMYGGMDFKIWVEWEKLLIVDYAILPHKVGVLVQKRDDSLPFTTTPSPKFLLKSKILSEQGWKIINLEYESYMEKGEERNEWVKKAVEEMVLQTRYRVAEDKIKRALRVQGERKEYARSAAMDIGADDEIFEKAWIVEERERLARISEDTRPIEEKLNDKELLNIFPDKVFIPRRNPKEFLKDKEDPHLFLKPPVFTKEEYQKQKEKFDAENTIV